MSQVEDHIIKQLIINLIFIGRLSNYFINIELVLDLINIKFSFLVFILFYYIIQRAFHYIYFSYYLFITKLIDTQCFKYLTCLLGTNERLEKTFSVTNALWVSKKNLFLFLQSKKLCFLKYIPVVFFIIFCQHNQNY